jgi:hypothetical protein
MPIIRAYSATPAAVRSTPSPHRICRSSGSIRPIGLSVPVIVHAAASPLHPGLAVGVSSPARIRDRITSAAASPPARPRRPRVPSPGRPGRRQYHRPSTVNGDDPSRWDGPPPSAQTRGGRDGRPGGLDPSIDILPIGDARGNTVVTFRRGGVSGWAVGRRPVVLTTSGVCPPSRPRRPRARARRRPGR